MDVSLEAPSAWVQRFASLVRQGGEVLDVACGTGRHARLFARLGCRVEAVDIDPACGLELAGVPGVHFSVHDLEGRPWPYPQRRFDAIVVTRYLHRPLWANLAASLADGGVLIAETFAEGQERYGRPRNPLFLLRPFELAGAFAGRLHILAFEDGVVAGPARIQRMCAVRAPAGDHERLRLDPAGNAGAAACGAP